MKWYEAAFTITKSASRASVTFTWWRKCCKLFSVNVLLVKSMPVLQVIKVCFTVLVSIAKNDTNSITTIKVRHNLKITIFVQVHRYLFGLLPRLFSELIGVVHTHTLAHETLLPRPPLALRVDENAVSYTHLDVYKRQ